MSSPLLTATPRPQIEGYYRLLRPEPVRGHDGATNPAHDEEMEQQFFVEWEVPQAT